MRKLIIAAIMALPGIVSAQGALGEVVGTVLNEDKMPISSALVQTESNGNIYKDRTDLDGQFRISAIPAGKYLFMIIKDGDTMRNVKADIPMDGIASLYGIEFKVATGLGTVDIIYDREQLRLATYGVRPEIKMTAEEIKRSPLKFDQKAMIAAMSSDIKVSEDGQLMFRGARKGDMIYMMDGVKMTDVSNVPSASIGGMMVYTGGIPAKYGDTTGGVVVMETKSYFDLYREWRSSQND